MMTAGNSMDGMDTMDYMDVMDADDGARQSRSKHTCDSPASFMLSIPSTESISSMAFLRTRVTQRQPAHFPCA
jgi:hypothetical protein